MTKGMSDNPNPPRKPPTTGNPNTREARLAAALRTNLRRRKADRAAPTAPDETPAADLAAGGDAIQADSTPTAQASAIPATKNPRDGS